MRFTLTTLLAPLILLYPQLVQAQVAPGGGGATITLAPTQYPVTTIAPSLTTYANGTVDAIYMTFTQTFATTALGSWDLGPTPQAGTIGLGSIQGQVGNVKTKRALETPSMRMRGVSE